MKHPQTIIYFTNNVDGGAETQIRTRFRHMTNRGKIRMVLYYCDGCETAIAGKLSASGIKVAKIRGIADPFSRKGMESLRRILKKSRPDFVMGFWHSQLGLSAVIQAKKMGLRTGLEVQSSVESSLYHPQQVLALPFMDVMIPCSRRVGMRMHRYFNIPRNKIHTVLNGIDIPKRIPVRQLKINRKRVVTMIGRFHMQKDYTTFFQAAKILSAQGRYHFQAVGNGGYLPIYQALVKKLGISDRVSFIPFVRNIDRILKKTDVLCLATHFEGLPVSILEAMACGLPVVATRVDGIAETIRNGWNGFLVPRMNPEKMAESIDKIVSGPKGYRKFSNHSGNFVSKNFDIRNIVPAFESIFQTNGSGIRKTHPAKWPGNPEMLEQASLFWKYQRYRDTGLSAKAFAALIPLLKNPDVFPNSRLKKKALFELLEMTMKHSTKKRICELADAWKSHEKELLNILPQKGIIRFYTYASWWEKNGFASFAENLYRKLERFDDLLLTRESAGIRYHLGRHYLNAGQMRKARNRLKECLRLDPSHQAARKLLERINAS